MSLPHVSDHALVRFCERALSFDTREAVSLIQRAIGDAREGLFKLPGYEVAARVKDNVVVSIVPIKPPKRHKKKRVKTARPIKNDTIFLDKSSDWRDYQDYLNSPLA